MRSLLDDLLHDVHWPALHAFCAHLLLPLGAAVAVAAAAAEATRVATKGRAIMVMVAMKYLLVVILVGVCRRLRHNQGREMMSFWSTSLRILRALQSVKRFDGCSQHFTLYKVIYELVCIHRSKNNSTKLEACYL